ncbi:MAG: hypothetical protein WCJ02_16975 [bacterium]
MNNNKEQRISLLFSIIGTLAILINLFIKGFSTENMLDALKDLVGLAVTIAVFIVANRISSQTNSFLEAGKKALIKLLVNDNTKKYLDGIKANSEKSDIEEENDKRNKYLFIKRIPNLKSKVTFIPVNDLEDGILDIRVSKGTLINRGFKGLEGEVESCKKKVAEEVLIILNQKGLKQPDDFEIVENPKSNNSAIVIDFNEQKLGFRKFRKIVFACAEKALLTIQEFK